MANFTVKTGRLTADPEFLPEVGVNKTPLCKFSIAVDRDFGEGTDFFDIITWRKLAELCSDHLGKGRKVLVVGRDQHRTYDKKDGTKGFAHEIIADKVEFLDWPKDKQPQGTNTKKDVPF